MGASNSLPELIDRLLDRGLVIESWVRLSLAGIEVMDIEARMVVASIGTYLHYAQAIAETPLPAVGEDVEERAPLGSTEDALTPYLNTSPERSSSQEPPVWYKIAPN